MCVCACVCVQDFPSIYQVRQKLIENDIITIFAVSENAAEDRVMVTDLYGVSHCIDNLWSLCCLCGDGREGGTEGVLF